MSVAEFVSNLRKLDVRLSAEGERLRVNAPKGVLTDSLRSEIAKLKEELLEFLSENEQPAAFTPAPILRRAAGSPAPLSFAQERLWFLEQLEPGSPAYNICRASRLTGQLNIAALEASLTEILRRHEILRSQIHIVDGRPTQITISPLEVKLHFSDLRSLPRTERDAEVRRQIRAEEEWQFDFSAGLFLRAVLIQVNDDQHILVLTTHHIVSDAWSMGILTRELWTLYDSYANGRPVSLPELPVQYADYALWQREWLQGDVLEFQLSYWKEQLKELPILNFPTDHPRPVKQSFRGGRQPLSLSESLTAAVNELSRREGVTQFMTLLAVFQVLLYRYSGQEDIVVGLPIANRNRTETEGLIGFFVNTLVLRADLYEKPSFKELLQRVRNVCLQAYAHQDLPFEKLVEELRPERDLSRNPLFQMLFVLQNTPRPLPQPAALSIEPIDVLPATSLFDLSLYLRERDGKLIGFFEYNTDLFESSTIERMIGHFETLLKGIVADPEQPISTLPLLSNPERHQLLVEWNQTEADYPKDSCIHELFEAQVESTPKAIAVQLEGKYLTYRELNSRANQLARYLKGLGIGREKLVGICSERSLEMVVGLLGILKAGGAYVPFDPAYPRKRLEFMLNDAQISVLLTQKPLVRRFLQTELLIVCLDDLPVFDQKNKDNLTRETNADSAAYVIYTSGSTGTPKGVVGLHSGAVNRFAWMWSTYPFRPNEMSCIKTSLSFVDSVWEIFGPLLVGVPSTIVPDGVAKDPQQLIQTLADNRVTRIVLVPSLLRRILDVYPDLQTRLPNLKLWSSSGEPLSKELAQRFAKCLPNRTLLNLYGSSEVSADVTYYDLHDRKFESDVPIGRPIGNTSIYLLDPQLQPVPIGACGELYVAGAGLARGYLNRQKLNTEKFIANPFRSEPDFRLYKTGDLARYLPDGNIEFKGRIDNQLKIRGYRIEAGEVESVLNQHVGVRESVVVAWEDVTDERWKAENLESKNKNRGYDNELVAYVVPATQQPSIMELRSFLSETLPDYMLPSAFVMLEALPLMPNGKVDRQSLPKPVGDGTRITGIGDQPRTQVEELVMQIWKEVLRLEKVGIHDNFFQAGGNSLMGARIVSRISATFEKEVPLRALFETPTVAGLANVIEKTVLSSDGLDLPPIVPVCRKGPLPISIFQEPFFVIDQLIGGAAFLNMPYAYRLTGPLDVVTLRKAIQEIVRRHEVLRTVFSEVKDRPTQSVRPTQKIRLPVIDLSRLTPDKRKRKTDQLSKDDAERRFDLQTGPLLRTKLLRLKEDEHILLVTLHHIVSDQWSMGVFRTELGTLYEAFSQRQSSPLPEPSLHFIDFVLWQRQLLVRGRLNPQISFWEKQLAEPLSGLNFKDRYNRRKRGTRLRSSRQPIEVDVTLFESIKAFARKENCTIFMVLVAAVDILLHLYTGGKDIRIGTLVANRIRNGTAELIGYFVNTVILRTYVRPTITCEALLKTVRDVCLLAYAHQDLPFEYLESLLERKRKRFDLPLYHVMLNYRNFPFEPRQCSGLTIASWNGKNRLGDPGILVSKAAMMIHLRNTSTKLTGAVNYKTDDIGDQLMANMIGSFRKILAHMILEPESRVGDFSIDVDP